MAKYFLQNDAVEQFRDFLIENEKSRATVEKYCRDCRRFLEFTGKEEITKEKVLAYKQKLIDENYAVSSINSMLASLHALFDYLRWHDLKVKNLKTQRKIFRSEEKELTRAEYLRLVQTAKEKGDKRLSLLLQTVCGTGIRISELQFITVEAVKSGEATVNCKGKTRSVFLVKELRKKLLAYAKNQKIRSGAIFITRSGKPMNRTNIWREMKSLCQKAKVNPEKVFPHNLRHLFAITFYEIEKDIVKLADLLGHTGIDTTRIYIISTGAEHRRKMEKMRLVS